MPFNLAFRMEAIISVEIGLPITRVEHYGEEGNTEWLCIVLNLIEET